MGDALSDKPLSETLRDFGPTNLMCSRQRGILKSKAGVNLGQFSKS